MENVWPEKVYFPKISQILVDHRLFKLDARVILHAFVILLPVSVHFMVKAA